jgi:hypothetical protein
MMWHHLAVDEGDIYTEVAKAPGGCLVRTYGWERKNFETAMGMGLVFIPGASLADFGVDEDE